MDAAERFLVGVSIGGVEAHLVARRKRVRGMVVINTVAKPFLECLLATPRRQMRPRHVAYEEIDRRMLIEKD